MEAGREGERREADGRDARHKMTGGEGREQVAEGCVLLFSIARWWSLLAIEGAKDRSSRYKAKRERGGEGRGRGMTGSWLICGRWSAVSMTRGEEKGDAG